MLCVLNQYQHHALMALGTVNSRTNKHCQPFEKVKDILQHTQQSLFLFYTPIKEISECRALCHVCIQPYCK